MNDTTTATAAVVFRDFADTAAVAQYMAMVTDFGKYIPGKFYQRELPGIVVVLEKVTETLDVVIIDGYVMFSDDRPGLGFHLWQHLGGQTAVIGEAKSPFSGAHPVTIQRGKSSRPLFITAFGMEPTIAAGNIIKMAGFYRIPDLLRQVDRLAKENARNLA